MVLTTISEEFVSHAVLKIITPVTNVLGAISVGIGALAVSLVVLKISIVDIAINAEVFALAVGNATSPVSLIL
jgi:hypothetical protein